MIHHWLDQLDVHLRALLPLATAIVAVLLDVMPLPRPGPEGLTTFATLCVVYFWSLYRPDLLTPAKTFLIGLAYDAATGLPLGLTSLVLLLARNLMVVQQRYFLARSFPVVWFCFVLLAPAVELVRWLLVSSWWGHPFAWRPPVFEMMLTIMLYPPASWLLGRLHSQIPRVIRAS